jgi:hypothetical protein
VNRYAVYEIGDKTVIIHTVDDGETWRMFDLTRVTIPIVVAALNQQDDRNEQAVNTFTVPDRVDEIGEDIT